MATFKKVFAGLALGTALAGGALALGATAASASTVPVSWHNNNDNNNCWNDNNNCCWQDNNCFNNCNNWHSSKDDCDSFAIATPCVAIGFQDKTCRDDCWSNNNCWQNNNCFNNNDNCSFNNNDNNDNCWGDDCN
ncbi:hypothetical protein N5079_20405 [Planotetraspora sp. A-T 1434]|uniref:hypothetical protein n=1 Tax=Planotetraspora sp. A-T 1434 TaxID=2979219 RepID=UPI0021C0B728|nr:hypothetical protein [Planotetraspora sp. A-T 1434]MCT9932566.1 hypothetical protein [Planotetraspora sp. A-T 1434]